MLVAGFFVTASLSHHLFSIWEKKGIWIILDFLLLTPLTAWIFSKLSPRFSSAFQRMKSKQKLFLSSAFVLGSFATFLSFRAPISYQTITITPQIAQSQRVELLEIKVGGDVLPVEPQAVENGWSLKDSVLSANRDSQSLQMTFQGKVNAKITVLFNSSPEGGKVLLSYGNQKEIVDLSSPALQQRLITLHCNYRSISRWLFIPFLAIADIFSFSLLFLLIFLLQEEGQKHLVEDPHERFPSQRASITILIVLACLLHLLNALAVPLIVSSDSPHYLQGAVHLLKYGNFDGVSLFCGPGTTFFFAPVLLLFGRNPWGMKLFLHLIAIACVLLAYRLGWQLSKKRWVAFCIGFATMLLPDLYYYSNFIMSDLINIFLVMLFTSLLLEASEKYSFVHVLLPLLVASFATLLRAENLLLLPIGVVYLGFQPGMDWLKVNMHKKNAQPQSHNARSLTILFLALLISLLPLLWWSCKNLQLNGYFGVRNSGGTVLYDGWVYYAEASGIDFQDDDSPAVQEIEHWIDIYPIEDTEKENVATGGKIYPSLIKAGHSPQEAFDLLEQAALDSIKANYRWIPKIVELKLKDAFKPRIYHMFTYPLDGESTQPAEVYAEFFNTNNVTVPFLINTQRAFYEIFQNHLAKIYRFFTLFALVAALFSLYRKPFLQWFTLVVIVLTRIFISNLISIAMWRYTMAGIVFLVVFGLIGSAVLIYGIQDILTQKKGSNE